MATVIRVKRKRHGDPAEALLLTCKRAKNDETFLNNSGMADIIQIEEKLFHFAATVNTGLPLDENVKDKVKSAMVLRNKMKAIYKTDSCRKRVACTELPTNHFSGHQAKYRLVDTKSTHPAKPTVIGESNAADNSDSSTIDHGDEKPLALLDMEENALKSSEQPSQSNDTLNNSIKMLKDLKVSKTTNEDDFVYDLYYCQKTPQDWNVKDILYVQPCNEDELVFDSDGCFDKNNCFDDDEDSNDENHHGNDYPDEDSMDEDERRLMFDEEEDRYDSDDGEDGRYNRDDDDDLFGSMYPVGMADYNDAGRDDYFNNDVDYTADDYGNNADMGCGEKDFI